VTPCSAKVIPGNEPQVARLMNSLALLGAQVKQSRADNLHTSGGWVHFEIPAKKCMCKLIWWYSSACLLWWTAV
jgi:hypothetical protein